jgi:deoxyhypusine monooxygenase
LFRHEIAYVLGQMLAKAAIPTLSEVLQDTTDDPIVRHESGEALGAIADPSTLPLLEKFADDARPEVAETCQIASRRVKWVIDHGDKAGEAGNMADNPFESVDPAPAEKKPSKEQVPVYAAQLLDQSLPLFERYKAMFSLRNNRSKAAVLALCKGLEDPSPLFRHEVAYVLGQLAHPASATALMASVTKEGEHEMVRHEAAEAIGAIGTEECVEFLQKYVNDGTVMLKESCIVAIDAADYWASSTDDTKIEGSTATA